MFGRVMRIIFRRRRALVEPRSSPGSGGGGFATPDGSPRGIPIYRAPRLLVAWRPRFADFPDNLRALAAPRRVTPAMLKGFAVPLGGGAMRPRSFGLSAAVHLMALALLVGLPFLLGRGRPATPEEIARMRHQKLTWYFYNDELPRISPEPGKGEKRSEAGGRRPGPAPRGATEFQSQVIISNPPEADNARQTIVQPDTPNIRITQDVRIPNVVMWAQQTARPSLELLPAPSVQVNQAPRLLVPPDIVRPAPPVDPQALAVRRELKDLAAAKIAPGVATVEPPAPDVPNLEQHIANLKVAAALSPNPIPRLALPPATTAPVTQSAAAARADAADNPPALRPAEPIPSSPAVPGGGSAGAGRLIALGVDPAPPGGGISAPPGNRSGSFSIGRTGETSGTAGGTPNGSPAGTPGAGAGGPAPAGDATGEGARSGTGAGEGARHLADIRVPGLSIAGGVRPPSAAIGPVVSGPVKTAPAALPAPPAPARPAANPHALAALIARGARPQIPLPEWGRGERRAEQGFLLGKKIYTVYINMPNLTSQSGSWIMRFSELADRAPGGEESDLSAPVARRKVDPGYHPDAIRERVQGAVTLYAVIHRDGSVNSVRVVRGLDPRLDERAVKALLRWQFDPARRNGSPVDLEALVQIPFSLNGNGAPF